MKSITEQTLEYFSATNNDFWEWADKGTVIEWMNGLTICYREDLLLVLRGLSPYGLPPMGSVLMLMYACQGRWEKAKLVKEELDSLFKFYKKLSPNILVESYLKDAIRFLDMVNELPENLRTGPNRVHLFQEIFKKERNEWVVNPKEVVDEFLSGRLDQKIFSQSLSVELSAENFRRDLMCLSSVSRNFINLESLELAIKTGLKELPTPIDLEENEEEDHEEKSLLDQLKEDAKTEGIARLCKRIIAGLNIPMHSQGVSDQSFGGVSDITNRGDIDKLLLSELAYDDTTLMVRLANNEAMYLRREELPSNLHKERIILMDSTIKMWGVPRVFATSVGLACAIQDKNVASIQSHVLSGEKNHPIDLTSKEGVIAGLEKLHPELHCADALHLFVEENKIDDQTELILITDEQSLKNEDFRKTLNEVRSSLTYLITINRHGRLHFYEYALSGRRLISTTLYDLEELLFKKDKKFVISRSKIDPSIDGGLPAIYRQRPFPIYFPTPSIRFTPDNTFDFRTNGVAAITNSRILYWKQKWLGARELLLCKETSGKYEVAYFDEWVYVLEMKISYRDGAQIKILSRWSAINLIDDSRNLEVDYSGREKSFLQVKTEYGKIYLLDKQRKVFFIDSETGNLEVHDEPMRFGEKQKMNFSQIKKKVNNGYTTLKNTKRLTILFDKDGFESGLKINDWELSFNKYGLYFEQSELRGRNYNFADDDKLKREKTVFRRADFGRGNYVIGDTNGLIHLISADETIPQVTIPMIVGGAHTAAWASDGAVTGSNYFVDYSNPKRITSEEFHRKYMQPFFNNISDGIRDVDAFLPK